MFPTPIIVTRVSIHRCVTTLPHYDSLRMADQAGTISPNESRRHFRKRVRKALNDPSLQRALRQAMIGLRERRNGGFQSYDFATGRADLKQRRLANLERLPELPDEVK